MELFVIVAQLVKDLLGDLNPFRLLNRKYRNQAATTLKSEPPIIKLGYAVGITLLLVLVGLLVLYLFAAAKD